MPEISTTGAVAMAAAAVTLGAVTGVGSAANITLNGDTLSTGSVVVTPVCNSTPANLTAVRSSFTTPTTYEIRRVTVSALAAACRAKPYALTLAAATSPNTGLGEWTGTTPATASGNLDTTSGVDTNSVPSSNQLRVYMVVSTS